MCVLVVIMRQILFGRFDQGMIGRDFNFVYYVMMMFEEVKMNVESVK